MRTFFLAAAAGFAVFAVWAAEAPSAQGADRIAIAVEALSRLKGMDLEANPSLKGAVMRVIGQTRGTAQFVELARDFDVKGEEPALLEFALAQPGHSAAAEAVKLIFANDGAALIESALASTNALKMAEALGNSGAKQAPGFLAPVLTDGARPAELRKSALRGLLQSEEGAQALIGAAKSGKLPEDLKLAAAAGLHQVRWPEIKQAAAEVLPLPLGRDAEPLPPVAELAKRSGNALRGKELFFSPNVGCSTCHQVNSQGTDFGPKLSEIGSKLGKDALYEAIINPSGGISFGYEGWQVETTGGDELFGIINSETAEEISVKAQTGVATRVKKADVAKREKMQTSVMPAGLQELMSTGELIDLVEYLSGLKSLPGN